MLTVKSHETSSHITTRHAATRFPIALRIAAAAILVASIGCAARTDRVELSKTPIDGITNFTRVDATTGCGGSTAPEALAELKRMGFNSIINFRLASEEGAEIERSKAAAESTGLRYIHIPFGGDMPDPNALVAQFLEEVAQPENQPVYLHCHSANRASAFWMIKRVLLDGWSTADALAEAEVIGLTNARIRAFAEEYVSTHQD